MIPMIHFGMTSKLYSTKLMASRKIFNKKICVGKFDITSYPAYLCIYQSIFTIKTNSHMSKKVDLINCPDFGNDLREEFRNISKFDPVYKYLQDVCLQRHPNINDVPSYSSPNFDYYKHPRVHENRAVEILDTPIGRASMFEYLYDDDGRRVRCVVHSVVSFQMDRYDCSSVIYLCVSFWDMINKIGQTFVYKNVAYRDLIAGNTLSS